MKETQSEIGKSENAKYSLTETLSNRSVLDFENSNVKYYKLKDLIDSGIESPVPEASVEVAVSAEQADKPLETISNVSKPVLRSIYV